MQLLTINIVNVDLEKPVSRLSNILLSLLLALPIMAQVDSISVSNGDTASVVAQESTPIIEYTLQRKTYEIAEITISGADSYEDFVPPSVSIEGQEDRFKEIFRKRKDIYRRQRDMSIFCFIGVYVLSIIDAYVDAELSNFDISKDLSMKVEPTTFNDFNTKNFNSVGLQCSFNF